MIERPRRRVAHRAGASRHLGEGMGGLGERSKAVSEALRTVAWHGRATRPRWKTIGAGPPARAGRARWRGVNGRPLDWVWRGYAAPAVASGYHRYKGPRAKAQNQLPAIALLGG
jgi:hypothetical protein